MSDTIYGTLNDIEITNLGKKGELIVENFDSKNVKQACYEMRAGNIYFDLSAGGKKYEIEDGGNIIFEPHQTIVIISKEKFDLPSDIIARFLTKGALFSVGFTPVNTYADPGFYGRIGMVMNNASNNYLKIVSGDVIAKVEFDRLQAPVKKIYKGQHGFETEVWPIRSDYIINREDVKKYLPNHDDIEEIRIAYGEPVAEIMQRIAVTERRFVFATAILIVVNLIIIGLSIGTGRFSAIVNVILGIITNACYAGISLAINKSKWRKKGKQ